MIIFNELRWKNFLSTGNNFNRINLNDKKTNLIVGTNGMGKSTILDAITFVLFNKPFRKINIPQLINTVNDRDCVVEIEFSIGKKAHISSLNRIKKDEEGNILFTDDDLMQFASTIAGQFGNPRLLGLGTGWMKPYDKFKCKVLDIEFYTYNERVYRDTPDESGNADFRKAEFGRGKKSDKYTRKRIQYVYKCKWIIGTDKCYDWGMAYDQKRSNEVKYKAKTKTIGENIILVSFIIYSVVHLSFYSVYRSRSAPYSAVTTGKRSLPSTVLF